MIRRLLFLGQPQETRFFLVVGVFGLVIAAIYWFLTYETAGTILLLGFGLAGGIIGWRLIAARPESVAQGVDREDPGVGILAPEGDASASGGGTGGVDRPFGDEAGRLPEDTVAPLALALGVALALTSIVFGPWLIVAAIIPFVWGAWAWFAGARDEYHALAEDDEVVAQLPPAPGDPGD